MIDTIIQVLVDWLQTNGIEGWKTIGGVTFHYLSLMVGFIGGSIVGLIFG